MGKRIVVFGSANMDLVVRVERLPRAGETLLGGDLQFVPGGKGANQACAAARLGGRVSMAGAVGTDSFGPALLASLEAAGVDTVGMARSTKATGCALISVLPGGENAILVASGANMAVEERAAEQFIENCEDVGFLLCQLETPLEAVSVALAAAKAKGAVTILDPAPARALPESLLRRVDILTPNQNEAALLVGTPGTVIESFEAAAAAAARLREMGCAAVIVKLGAAGCWIDEGERRAAAPGFAVEAVDTTAAGDVFNGALAVALAEGKPLAEAARFANAAAAISVTRAGAQTSVPRREEVERFLAGTMS